MVRLTLEVSDVDFDALVEQYLPLFADQLRSSGNPVGMLLSNGMGSGMAKVVLRTLSQEQREKLLCDLVNGSEQNLCASLEQFAQEKGIAVKAGHIQAECS